MSSAPFPGRCPLRRDIIPIQQCERDPVFVYGKPRATVAIAGIEGLGAIEFVDLRRKAYTPCDFFVTVHPHDVRIVAGDNRQSAHKPTARSRALSRF